MRGQWNWLLLILLPLTSLGRLDGRISAVQVPEARCVQSDAAARLRQMLKRIKVRPEIQVRTDRVESSPFYCIPAEMRTETGGRQKRGTVTTGIRR
ncbi:hypothetical protein HRbin10_01001 [bacterium HR10]|nr:hypothetical protein HRbin10_01001 [bacterium HR10]